MKLIIEIENETFNKVFHGGLFKKDNKLIESVTEAFQNVTIIPNEERPQAKSTWRRVTDDENEFLWFRCMNCRQISYINSKYCPNCGCGMKGGAE